jgi:replicative superfamily II helicase
MYHWSEAERLFHNEVREKKKTASGVHHKTGKNGYVGTMRFPSDIMSRKDKMRYRRSSKVMTTNMYDEIIGIEEFEKLETYEQRNRLQYWRNKNNNKEILAGMGISSKRYYEIVAALDLPKAPRVDRGGKATKRSAKVTKKEEPKQESVTIENEPPAPIEEPPPVQEIIVDGLHLVFNGTYSAELIQKQLKKFITLLDEEPDEFYLEFKLMQKAAQK